MAEIKLLFDPTFGLRDHQQNEKPHAFKDILIILWKNLSGECLLISLFVSFLIPDTQILKYTQCLLKKR